jgi:hypothetical protein
MKLKHGKKHETADGVVYRVRKHPYLESIWDVSGDTDIHWDYMGVGFCSYPNLIRRHYKKPQPAHKLDLKPGDVVELVTWEDGHKAGIGEKMTCIYGGRVGHLKWNLNGWNKGHRPLFRVVSRA